MALDAYREWATTPLTEQPQVSVVIPTYNEEWRILPTIGAIAVEMSRRGEPWELIISDDGSKDGTRGLVEGLDLVNMRLLTSPNTGKGGAVKRGVLASRGRYVLFAEADQSTPIEQFDRLLSAIIDGGADIAIGSRAVDGSDVAKKSLLRKMISSGLNLLVRVGYRIPIRDTQCGFKLFTAEAAKPLFDMQRLERFSFDLELLFLARKSGMLVTEVPVEWIDAPGSTVSPVKVSIQFLKDLVRIRWWQLRGHYRIKQHRRAAGRTVVPSGGAA